MEDFVRRIRERVCEEMRESARELNHLVAQVSDALVRGRISDDQAQGLFEEIQARRDRESREGKPIGAALPSLNLNLQDSAATAVPAPDSEFQIAERERRQERIKRRRYLGDVCSMPAQFSREFSTAEKAVLSQIVIRCADHGRCDLPVAAIAARANVAVRTVQSTLRKAVRLLLLNVQFRRRMTSVVTVANELWRKWIKAAPSRTEKQKCLILKESMDPLQGAISGTPNVSKRTKAPSKLDHSEPAVASEVDVLERPAPAPRPKRIQRDATPSVDDRLVSALAMVEEAARSRPVSDLEEWEKPEAESWMTARDKAWLSHWEAAERLDPRRYPNILTDRGAVRTDVLDWLSWRWGSAGTDFAYGIHRFMRASKPEIRIGFNAREKVAEFIAQWGRAVPSS